MTRITFQWQKPSCLSSPATDEELPLNPIVPEENVRKLNFGFFNLKIHRQSHMQRSLLARVPRPQDNNTVLASAYPAQESAPQTRWQNPVKDLSDRQRASLEANLAKFQAHVRGYRVRKLENHPLSDPYKRRDIGSLTIEDDLKRLQTKKKRMEELQKLHPDKEITEKDLPAFNLEPSDPLFYFINVQGSTKIKKALLEMPRFQQEVEALCADIDKGNWEILSNKYMEKRYPDQPSLHHVRIKDMLFYGYWSGKLSQSEFHTAISFLNLKEQFVEFEDAPKYRSTNNPEGTKLPFIKGRVDVHPLFDRDGNLTAEGRQYIESIGNKFKKDPEVFGKKFDANTMEEFIGKLKEMPKNLQVFFKVSDIATDKIKENTGLDYWFANFKSLSQAPLFAYGKDSNHLNQENSPKSHFHAPTFGMLHEFHSLWTTSSLQKAIVQPVRCLGVLGSHKEGELHALGWHPVVVYDDRITSNLVAPHGYEAGAYFAERHDADFHLLAATRHPAHTRKIFGAILPKIIDEAVDKNNPIEKEVADQFIEMMTDLAIAIVKPDGSFIERRLRSFGFLIYEEKFKAYQDAHDDEKENLKDCLRALEKIIDAVKEHGINAKEVLYRFHISDVLPRFIKAQSTALQMMDLKAEVNKLTNDASVSQMDRLERMLEKLTEIDDENTAPFIVDIQCFDFDMDDMRRIVASSLKDIHPELTPSAQNVSSLITAILNRDFSKAMEVVTRLSGLRQTEEITSFVTGGFIRQMSDELDIEEEKGGLSEKDIGKIMDISNNLDNYQLSLPMQKELAFLVEAVSSSNLDLMADEGIYDLQL